MNELRPQTSSDVDNPGSLDFHLEMSNFWRSVPFIDEINLKGEAVV